MVDGKKLIALGLFYIIEKVFSQVNLFIDVLKFMLEKNRIFKLLEVDVVFS